MHSLSTALNRILKRPYRGSRSRRYSHIFTALETQEQRLVLAAPTISPIVDISLLQDAAEQSVAFTGVSDGDDGTQPLRITATSSSPGVIPHPSVTYDSPGSSGTLQFTPVAGISGPVQMTVTVEDGGPDGDLETPEDNESMTTSFGIGVQAAVTGFGVAGDSLSDEFLHESYSYASNWVEILESQRNLNFGARNDTSGGNADDRGEPRREGGFAFNWARSGATSGSLLDQQQHTALAGHVAAGDVSHVVLFIGQNDFSPGLGTPYFQIYNNLWSAGRIEQHISSVLQNITTAVQTIDSDKVKLVLSNVVDYGIAPATQSFFTTASKRQRVTNVIDTLNQRLQAAADDWLIPVVDMNTLTRDLLAGGAVSVGGNSFARAGGVAVSNLFVADGAHPHTVSSSILANGFLAGFYYGYQDWIAPVTEQDVIEFIGLPYTQDTLHADYESYVILPVNDSPTLDVLNDVTILEDAGQQSIVLAGISAGGNESQTLQLTVTSDNPDLIPTPAVDYSSPNDTGLLRFTPVPGTNGTATITVTLTDAGVDGDLATKEDNGTVTRSFIVTVTPIRPTISSPGSTTASQRPRIEWSSVPGAASWQVWIGNSTTGVNPYLRGESATTSFDVPTDLGLGRMDLWVRGVRENGTFLPWTKMHRFRVVSPPVLDDLPRRQEAARPVVTWPEVSGAVAYDVWVNNFSTSENGYVRTRVTQSSWSPDTDLPMSRYRVWVRAEAADGGTGNWSVRKSFYTAPAPQALSPVLPTFDRTPPFDWSDISGASSYGVFVRSLVDGSVAANVSGLEQSQWTPEEDLPDGRYAWWAIADSDVAGFRSSWSTRQEFYVGGQTSVTGPERPVSSTTPLITWLPVTGADRYVLQVNGTIEGSKLIYRDDLTSPSFAVQQPLVRGGSYRLWVRAISTTGELAPWSQSLDFTVTGELLPQKPILVPLPELADYELVPPAETSQRTIVRTDADLSKTVSTPSTKSAVEIATPRTKSLVTTTQRKINAIHPGTDTLNAEALIAWFADAAQNFGI